MSAHEGNSCFPERLNVSQDEIDVKIKKIFIQQLYFAIKTIQILYLKSSLKDFHSIFRCLLCIFCLCQIL
jgi:hypothetical protein